MEKFDERKKSFEKKFAHDEELKFKVTSRRNKYLGQWVSQKLGYDAEKEKEYIQSVIKADFQEAGDEDVFRKIKADLKEQNPFGIRLPTVLARPLSQVVEKIFPAKWVEKKEQPQLVSDINAIEGAA